MAGSAVIGALRIGLGIDTAAFNDGLNQASSKLSSWGGIARKGILAITGGLAVGAVAIANETRKAINYADELSKASQKFGIPVEELSRLNYAAGLSDVALGSVGRSVGFLSKLMVQAADGNKAAVATFKDAGVEIQNADGSLKSSSDVLAQIADKMAAMPDGPGKVALAYSMLGKAGTQMIPVLNDGAASLQKLEAEASTFGQVISGDTATSANNFKDNIDRLGGVLHNLGARVLPQIIPYLEQFTNWLVANAPAIINAIANFAAIIGKVAEFAAGVVKAAYQFGVFTRQVVQSAADLVTQITATFTGLKDRFVQLGKDIIQGLIDGMKSLFSSAVDTLTAWFGHLTSEAKTAAGAHSPSTIFAGIGRDIMAGLQLGIQQGAPAVTGEMTTSLDGLSVTAADVARTAGGAFDSFVTGLIDGSASASDAVDGLAKSLGNLVLGKAASGIFEGLFGSGGFLPIPGYASGTANTGGTRGAPVGLVHGQEAVIPLPSGGRIPVDVRGAGVVVNIHNAPAGTRAEESTGPNGQRQIEVFIESTVDKAIAQHRFDRSMRSNFGISRRAAGL